MSQVDYLHYFNNIIMIFLQYISLYFFICCVYVQMVYKILRLRLKIKSKLFLNKKFLNVIGGTLLQLKNNLKETISNISSNLKLNIFSIK